MGLPRRIAAGALTFHNDCVLLVRYPRGEGESFLVGPGGGVEDSENLLEAVVRETEEETGLRVAPRTVVAIEDLLCPSFKMVKIWFACDLVGGQLAQTAAAAKEGISLAAWYRREELEHEAVYPPILLEHSWSDLRSDLWRTLCLPCRTAPL